MELDQGNTGRGRAAPFRLARLRLPKGAIAAIIAAAILSAIAAWAYGSPGWTIDRMRALANAGDGRAVMEYVDLPAFKADLNEQIREQLTEIASRQGSGADPLTDIATEAILGQMANSMASRQAIAAAFADRPTDNVIPPGGLSIVFSKLERDGLLQFRLHRRGEKAGHGDLIFRLQGLSWRLVGINFPATKTPAELAADREKNDRIAAKLGTRLVEPETRTDEAVPTAEPENAIPDAPGWYTDSSLPEFIRQVYALEEECRGGIDEAAVVRACRERDLAFERARASGWCFGNPDEPYSERVWKPCERP